MARWICVVTCVLFVSQAALADTPFQFAAPNLRVPDDPNVNGVRLGVIHSECASVRGFDVGIASLSETANMSGFSAVLGVGKVMGEMNGFATGLINLHTGTDSGVNAAFINRIHMLEHGANVGFVNIADAYSMVDVGGFNLSDRSTVQLGFVNVTRELESFQFGFINIAENGFMPIFPIFNFPKP